MLASRSVLGVLFAVATLTLAACGDDGGAVDASDGPAEAEPLPAPGDQKAELGHIHGLGVDPSSEALYVATHYGLFRAPRGQVRLERVGESRQDTMGFSVVGPRRFLGSGHPDPSENQPPDLGLIESRNGGTSWKNISLLGAADFHVLRSAGRKVYGYNGGTGKLMVSDDGGRKWNSRTPPAPMFDLAIDPTDPNRIVASTEKGISVSRDAGKRWQPQSGDVAGLLAWPTDVNLFVVDGQGQVSRSTDAGRSFDVVGTVGGPPSAFINHGDDLLVALGDGNVVRSNDAGASWQVTATP